jgi:hypothetical protein
MYEDPKLLHNILDECIDRILAGDSLELCLKRYPLQQRELESLLKTVITLKNAISFEPPQILKEKVKRFILKALQSRSSP